jgi:putative heme-binding domain-containing protein
LYWNFGNTGKAVHDAAGNLVVDQSGKTVIDNGQPYYGGMVFRCNLDGSQLETLAHNFRNNYETAIDAFGTLWQTDNDDDGNKAARVNYVMEYGNYGYRDQLTGAGWQAPRINQEATVPERHWHLNDPGVVPTMLITGAGSPSALTFYEGDLLPQKFCNQILHCEPGLNVVRAYPVTAQGAGYQATIENLLQADGDNWFRPVDVCSAPDGSLWITDWYDPGVGGHAMGDLGRGRLFRLAPVGARYQIPALDVSTHVQAAAALVSPNQATRFLAWQAIAKFGKSSQAALEHLSVDANPRHRARALWALGKLVGNGNQAVASALSDQDPDVRCMGVRLARQLRMSPAEYFPKVLADSSPPVRRELAIALRQDQSSDMSQLWASLAAGYDGGDRWMVEALGIGADMRWDDCFKAYAERMASQNLQPHPDIAWRARTQEALPYLIQHLQRDDLATQEIARLLRSLDFQPKSESMLNEVKTALAALMQNKEMSQGQRLLAVELLMIEPQAQSAVDSGRFETLLQTELQSASRSRKLEILTKLDVPGKNELLIEMSSHNPVDSASVAAAAQVLQAHKTDAVIDILKSLEPNRQTVLIQAIAAGSPKVVNPFLQQAAKNDSLDASIRIAAAKGLARSPSGANRLLRMTEAGDLLPEARMVIGSLLRQSSDQEIRRRATELFPPPKSKTTEELPPLDQLLARSGNAQKGADIYRTTGTCTKCHPLGTDTRPVGPDLSEIGNKLAKEALYVAILDPSAGISHNYESYSALTSEGQVITGLLISQTDGHVVLRDAEGIDRTLRREELDEFSKLSTSLMPSNIIELLSAEELVDLVEYLQTLKKKQ